MQPDCFNVLKSSLSYGTRRMLWGTEVLWIVHDTLFHKKTKYTFESTLTLCLNFHTVNEHWYVGQARAFEDSVSSHTSFVGGGVCGHAPRAWPSVLCHHDWELIHGIWLEASRCVAERRCVFWLYKPEISKAKRQQHEICELSKSRWKLPAGASSYSLDFSQGNCFPLIVYLNMWWVFTS